VLICCTALCRLLACGSTMSAPTSARGGKAEMLRTVNSTLLTHLRHQRAIFAVMHSDVLAQRRANVQP
jgi:hypothetical protein